MIRFFFGMVALAAIAAAGWYAWTHRPHSSTMPTTPVQEHTLGGTISATTGSSITVTSANPSTEGQDITLAVNRNTNIFFYISSDQGLVHKPASLKDLTPDMQVSVLYAGETAESIGVVSQ